MMKDGKVVMCDKCLCMSCMNACDREQCRTVHGGYVGYCVNHRDTEQMKLDFSREM